MRMPCPNNVTYMTIWWYKCIVWISRISYSWHSQSSARRANQAHCKGKESCSQLPVAKTKLAVTTKRSRFLDQILPRPVLQSPQSSMYLGGLRHLQLTAARRCNQANCNCDSGRFKRFANVASRHRRSRSSNTNYTLEKTFYFISTYFQLQRNWLQDCVLELRSIWAPSCHGSPPSCHRLQTFPFSLPLEPNWDLLSHHDWIFKRKSKILNFPTFIGGNRLQIYATCVNCRLSHSIHGGRLAHSSQGSQRLQPWHALTLSPYLRQTVASGTSAFDSEFEAEEKPNHKNYNEPRETNGKNYNYTD